MAACARKKRATTATCPWTRVATNKSTALASIPRMGTLARPARYPHSRTSQSDRIPPSGIATTIANVTMDVKYRLVCSSYFNTSLK